MLLQLGTDLRPCHPDNEEKECGCEKDGTYPSLGSGVGGHKLSHQLLVPETAYLLLAEIPDKPVEHQEHRHQNEQ